MRQPVNAEEISADVQPTPPGLEPTAPSPFACVGRRTLAKLIDVTLFGALSLVVGRLLVPEQLSLGGLVPAMGTTLWAMGFFVAADTICAQLLGATPGEYLAGIRVCMADGTRLTWSARQDRTTDALVDGTLGVVGLMRALATGKPAPYDRDWRVDFLPLGGGRRALAALLTAVALMALLSAGVWLTVIKALDADARAAASKVARYLGLPARAVWVNPITGVAVQLPEGWTVRRTTELTGLGSAVAEFDCERGPPDGCRIMLGFTSEAAVGVLDVHHDTTSAAIEKNFDILIDEPNAMVVDTRDAVTGPARLDLLFQVALLPPNNGGESRHGLAWFSHAKNTWVAAITVSPAADGAALDPEEHAFVLSLVQSSLAERGR